MTKKLQKMEKSDKNDKKVTKNKKIYLFSKKIMYITNVAFKPSFKCDIFWIEVIASL